MFAAVLVLMAVFVGDWDNPTPPPRAAIWLTGAAAAAITLWIAWREEQRPLRFAAIAMLPLHAWFWQTMINGAYDDAASGWAN